MQFSDSLEQEVIALKLFFDEVPTFLRERTAGAALAGHPEIRDAYRMAQTIALEGGVHLLNSLVDGALLILANRTRGTDIEAQDMGRSRKTLEGEIEARLGVKLSGLTGWDDVDKIKQDANALKHRNGLTFAEGVDAPLTVTDDVNVTAEYLLKRVVGARVWLLEIDKCLTRRDVA